MNLSSLGFFRSLRSDRSSQQFAVIGLGRFGRAVCQTLHDSGFDVLGIDSDEKRVAQILNDSLAVRAIELDSTDPVALREAGVFEFNTIIVAIGNYVEESVITTLNLKESGVAHVAAKASSQIHEKLLRKVGADHVIFPEHQAGCELARSLTQPNILDRFDLDPENSIVELLVPEAFDGKTIAELQLRNKYDLTLLAVSYDGRFQINPLPNRRLRKGEAIVVIGSNQGLGALPS
ncbi:MAG: TrkA family potassium uptake protein [Microcoleus sp. SIO2G3]|nr:TrkA family potassium uptake protein [Microcoleus sp. SIO2G3]